MIGSIERVWRRTGVRPLLPAMALMIVIGSPTDPNRKNTGFGGVLPIPAPPVAAGPTALTRPAAIVEQQHRDQRAARGRVLYATGRTPPAAAPTTARVDSAKVHCDRRVVQARATTLSPNS